MAKKFSSTVASLLLLSLALAAHAVVAARTAPARGATEATLLAAAGAQCGGGAHNVFVLMQKREIINYLLSLKGTGVGTIFILTGQVSGTRKGASNGMCRTHFRHLWWRCSNNCPS